MVKSPLLDIQLLGPVEIISGGKPLKISRRIERTILYFLAAEHRPVSRTTLIDMLWPESDQMDQRGAFRTALSRLRNELPDPELILTELDQVWIDLDRCQIDSLRFEHFYQSLESLLAGYPENRPLPTQIVNQVQQALDFWHGDTLIHGENFSAYPELEIWRKSLDRELSNHRRFLMKQLAEHYQAAGRPEAALDLLTQLGQMDLLNVSIHLTVFTIMENLGRHQDAVDYCDALEVAFEHEFNTPLPDAILARCQYAQIQVNSIDQIHEKEWPVPLTMQLQMVGRQSELDQLKRAFYQGGLAVIRGEMGSGKTRLIQELYQTLAPKPALFLAPAHEMETSLPLSPIVHCLRRHVEEETWKEIDGVWANQLSLLLPELKEILGTSKQLSISQLPAGKQHLFDALHQLFKHIAKKSGRILFFLDDAQWADKQTLQALAYLLSQGFFDEHGLLIIAFRPEEPNPYLNEMIDPFHRNRPIVTITLNGLSPNDLTTLAQQIMDESPRPSLIDRLFQETNGNPFVALEIIRNILDAPKDIDKLEPSARLPLPESVHALLRRRLQRLNKTSRDILLSGAVLGNAFSLKTLMTVADLNPSSDISKIDPLIESGFIQSIQEANPKLSDLHFTHEKMREVVLREASPIHLQMLHQRAAECLVERPQSMEKAAIIASHYLAGGEVSKAFEWFLKSAEHAWTLGAKEEVTHDYLQAEKLYRNAPQGTFTIEEIFHFYQQWSEFAYESNQKEMLEETGLKLQFIGEHENNPQLIGMAQIALANACFLRLKFDTGFDIINRAIENLQGTNKQEVLIQALLRKAAFHWWKMEYDETIKSSKRILEIIKTIEKTTPNLISLSFNAHHMASMSYFAKGNAKKTLQLAQETHNELFDKLSAFDRMRMFNMLAFAHQLSADFINSKKFSEQGLEIAIALENVFVQEILLLSLSRAELVQGLLDESYAHAARALKLGEQNNHMHTIVAANCTLGDIYAVLQNFTLATQHHRVAQIREGFSTFSLHGMENDTHLARILIWSGHIDEGKEIIYKTLETTERTGMEHHYAQAMITAAICDVSEGKLTNAEHKLTIAHNIGLEKGLIIHVLWSRLHQAQIELSRHQFDKAEQLLKYCLEESRPLGMVAFTLRALKLSSQLHKAIKRQTDLHQYRSVYKSLINHLEEHTQSEPLRQDFLSTKRLWEEGHHYP